jgi:hypothetical protein
MIMPKNKIECVEKKGKEKLKKKEGVISKLIRGKAAPRGVTNSKDCS